MNAGSFAAFAGAWLLGILLVDALRGPGPRARGDRLLVLSAGLLLGLALSGTLFFGASLLSPRPALAAGAGELALGLMLGWRRWRRPGPVTRPATGRAGSSWLRWLFASLLAQALVVAVVCGWRAYRAEPYGGWDAWAIWNFHARAMGQAGMAWPALLAEPALSWTHPDYPRLVASAVARLWAWGGSEAPAASALVSSALAAGGAGVLLAVAARVRGWTLACAAALALVGTPFFITFAPNQHADLPLASYLLASVGFLLAGTGGAAPLRGSLFLAGLSAGMAGWTKNEGLLFSLLFAVLGGMAVGRRHGRAACGALALGLVAGLAPVTVFKLTLAPGNDLLSAPLGPRLAGVFDAARHRTILAALGRDLAGFGEWRWPPYVALALPFLAWGRRRRLEGTERTVGPLTGLMLAGYYVVYLLSPQDLGWHLNTSLVRLLLQLWPLAILGWVLAVPAVDASEAAPVPTGSVGMPVRTERLLGAGLVLVNLGVALALGTALARQPAAREVALGRGAAAGVTVALGEGWHAPERHDRDRWAWSSGPATLWVYAAQRPGAAVTLRFGLRSSGRRIVTVTQDGTLRWRGEVAGELVRVELPGLSWPGGVLPLAFTTDEPGVAEAPGDGGRVLAFALFNVEVR